MQGKEEVFVSVFVCCCEFVIGSDKVDIQDLIGFKVLERSQIGVVIFLELVVSDVNCFGGKFGYGDGEVLCDYGIVCFLGFGFSIEFDC